MKKQILHIIKRLIVNTLATTAMSILLVHLVGVIKSACSIEIQVPFEILLVNFLAHAGFILFYNINMKYKILNYLAMLVYLLAILIGFCFVFDWFAANEIWILCLIGVTVFIAAFVIDLIKINRDAKEINSTLEELRKRKDSEDK